MAKYIDDNLTPEKIKSMSIDELNLLTYEIRDFLVEKISKTGGHLASNLGIVELTIALHKVFDTPKDKIVWDVGHQSYVHKIITGRASGFDNIRGTGGISGFPKRKESEYDTFDSGHSSNSVSVAFGMARARDLAHGDNEVIAVIGDGALTGGMAFEALNNAGASSAKLIVILNDNKMSISENTGGLTKHLSTLRTSKGYLGFKKRLKETLKNAPGVYKGAESIKSTLKYALVEGSALVEELGFSYMGPVNGNNLEDVIEALTLAKETDGPVFLHVTTRKGKGYRNAEEHPDKFHGIGAFDPETGTPLSSGRTYSDVFGDALINLAEKNEKVVAVCAAMADGTGLTEFATRFPERFFDVGIAEQHAVSFAAGLALSGYRPVVAVYSTFLQRAYDQIMTDVALQKLPVIFAVDRAGIVGADGETHQGIFDISYFSSMPGMTVLAPSSEAELKEMLEYALTLEGPCAIRYPRGCCDTADRHFTNGHLVLSEGRDCEILAAGSMTDKALKISEILRANGVNSGVTDVQRIKPLDKRALTLAFERTKFIITMEDNVLRGGFGEAVTAFAEENAKGTDIMTFGWPDKFIENGKPDDLYDIYGLSSVKAAERILKHFER